MAVTVKLATTNAIVKNQETGGIIVNFSDGNQIPFETATAMTDFVAGNEPSSDAARAYLIANRLAADPLLDSPSLWDGKQLTLDLEQAIPTNVFKVA